MDNWVEFDYTSYTEEVHQNNMDNGTIAAVAAVVGMILTGFGLSQYVPFIGPLLSALVPVATVLAGIWSVYSHTQKTATIAASTN